jgi:hypothetical protein
MQRSFCSVCREPYKPGLPAPPDKLGLFEPETLAANPFLRWVNRVSAWLPLLSILVACIVALWARTGGSSTWLPLAFVLLAIFAIPSIVGLQFGLTIDGAGMPLVRLIRFGAAVEGLAAGSLLVSTTHIGAGVFHRTVLLLTEFDEASVKGCVTRRHPPAVAHRRTVERRRRYILTVPNPPGRDAPHANVFREQRPREVLHSAA